MYVCMYVCMYVQCYPLDCTITPLRISHGCINQKSKKVQKLSVIIGLLMMADQTEGYDKTTNGTLCGLLVKDAPTMQ